MGIARGRHTRRSDKLLFSSVVCTECLYPRLATFRGAATVRWRFMPKILIVGVILSAATPSIARTFGGYECRVDCSGHKAGYEWAEARGTTDEARCEAILRRWPNRNSFYEGCLVYVEDPARGADEDDDGDEID
jgi:hypothetical protein